MKLRIPAPGQEDEGIPDLLLVILATCAFLVILLVGYDILDGNEAEKESSEQSAEAPRTSGFEAKTRRQLDAHSWTKADLESVLELGPRLAAEASCRSFETQIREGAADQAITDTLHQALKESAGHLPWSCLFRLYFEPGKSPSPLVASLAQAWLRFDSFSVSPDEMTALVTEYRIRRQRPKDTRFYHWVVRCALSANPPYAASCQELLRQLAPTYGRDLLEASEILLRGQPSDDVLIEAITGLARIAREGQPSAFRVEETREIPDYDEDLRAGAQWTLCRILNSPSMVIAKRAAQGLGETTRVQSRAWDEKTITRWRLACRLALMKPNQGSEDVALLAVITRGNPSNEPEGEPVLDYSLDTVIRLQHCPQEKRFPRWYCGVQHMRTRPTLKRLFAETGYLEWEP